MNIRRIKSKSEATRLRRDLRVLSEAAAILQTDRFTGTTQLGKSLDGLSNQIHQKVSEFESRQR